MRLHKTRTIAAQVFLAAIFSLLMESVSSRNINFHPECTSLECVKLANEYRNNLDVRGKPCDDFYDYVCHGWDKQFPKPNYATFWTMDKVMKYTMQRELKKLLEEKNPCKNVISEKAKQLYRTCMKTPSMARVDGNLIKSLMHTIGALSIFTGNNTLVTRLPWEIDNKFLHLTAESALFDFTIQMDHDEAKFVTELKPPVSAYGMLIRYTDWDNSTELQHYKSFLSAIVKNTAPNNLPVPADLLNIDLDRVIQFREKLRHYIKESFSEIHAKVTIEEFQKWYDKNVKSDAAKINWMENIRALYENTGSFQSVGNLEVHTKYFYYLAKLLEETPKTVTVDHIHLYFLERHLQFTSEMESDLRKSVRTVLQPTGKTRSQPERWQKCIETSNFKDGLAMMYIKSLFPIHNKLAVEQLLSDIKRLLGEQIKQSNWVDDKVKAESIAKVNSIKGVIGYSDSYKTTLTLPRHDIYDTSPIDLEGYYSQKDNRITVSAAFLQPPIYSYNVPYVINYGATAAFLAHELYHGFDNNGITYTSRGRKPWWPENMRASYVTQSQCFQMQYEEYREKECHRLNFKPPVKLLDTVNEDIADVMGLKLAYTGFKQLWEKSGKICPVLPGFHEFGCEKLFFIAFANMFCTSQEIDFQKKMLVTDIHSLARVRVNGAVANMREFSAAFGCNATNALSPRKICDIWKK